MQPSKMMNSVERGQRGTRIISSERPELGVLPIQPAADVLSLWPGLHIYFVPLN